MNLQIGYIAKYCMIILIPMKIIKADVILYVSKIILTTEAYY